MWKNLAMIVLYLLVVFLPLYESGATTTPMPIAEPALQCYQCREEGCDTTADCGPRFRKCYKSNGTNAEGAKFYESGCAEFPGCKDNIKGEKYLKELEQAAGAGNATTGAPAGAPGGAVGDDAGGDSGGAPDDSGGDDVDDSEEPQFRVDEDLKVDKCELCGTKLCNGQTARFAHHSTRDLLMICVVAGGFVARLLQ